jgi:hypothetical protein
VATAAARAAVRLVNQQTRAAVNAAVANFKNGTIDAAELLAALLAANVDPVVAGLVVDLNVARQAGALTYIYGLELARKPALLLRERVAAIGNQAKATLITSDQALAALAALGIPAANAQALVAGWVATHTSSSDIGIKIPV